MFSDNQDGRSRALDSLGRVSMKLGKHEAALGYWNRKLHTMDSKDEIEAHIHDEDETLERIWLYHEIGLKRFKIWNFLKFGNHKIENYLFSCFLKEIHNDLTTAKSLRWYDRLDYSLT